MPTPTSARLCTDCKHFRAARPISTLLRFDSKNALEAITQIAADETQTSDAEAKLKVELIRIGRRDWGSRPLMSDHCAERLAENIFEIHELKNRDGQCPGFALRTPAPPRDCNSCRWQELHGDPYARLEGITNNDSFRRMKDGIDAEIGLEVTKIYARKGHSVVAPIAHDYCEHYSNPGASDFVALPYPNRHKDCLFHEPKDSSPISRPARQRKRPSRRSAMEHETIAFSIGTFIAAIRSATDGDEDALLDGVSEAREKIDDDRLLEYFDAFLVFNFKLNASNPVFSRAAEELLDLLGSRAKRLARNDRALMTAIENNPFVAHGHYLMLGDTREMPATALAEACVQTVCEGYWLDQLGLPARRRFLEAEQARIDGGLYPPEAIKAVKRVASDLERVQSKTEKAAEADPESDWKSALSYVAPLSSPAFIEVCEQQSSIVRVPNPFEEDPLDDDEHLILEEMIEGSFTADGTLPFLEKRHEILLQTINNFWRVGDPGNLPFEFSPYDKLTGLLTVLDVAHRYVTTILNRHSRRLRPAEHEEFLYAPTSINNAGAAKVFATTQPTLGRVLFSTSPSLETMVYAARASATPPARESRNQSKRRPAQLEIKKRRSDEPTFADLERLLAEEEAGGSAPHPDLAQYSIELQRQYDQLIRIRDNGKKSAAEMVFRATVATLANNGILNLPASEFNELDTSGLVDWLSNRGVIQAS